MAERESVPAPVTVVTGASEGLGPALAYEFARAGHALLLVARGTAALKAAAEKIRGETGVRVGIHSADLATRAGCKSVVAALGRQGLYGEFLVNNAGVGLSGPLAEYEHDALMRLVDLNIRALSDLTRRLLPDMIARDSGGILNVASLAGFMPGPYQAAYFASKAYVISLSEALAHELALTNVRVSVFAPGPLATRFHERIGSQSAFYLRFQGVESVEQVARTAYAHFMRGRRVIVPGVVNTLSAALQRVTPHTLLVPFAAWLLKLREESAHV
ncbi:MAG: SDR family oxidoreductase [Proteobacteria bacterium]|nr:SDR family oxidoreductase [Pseudomonadota bacterium]